MPAYNFVEDVLTPFMRRRVKKNTALSYITSAKFLTEFFQGMMCTDSRRTKKRTIDGAKVAAFREWRRLQGVSVYAIRNDVACAAAACNWAIRNLNYDFRNPFAGRTVAEGDRGKLVPDRRIYTSEEIQAILANLDDVDGRIFKFLNLTGFRVNEALKLTRDRINGPWVSFTAEQQKSSKDRVRAVSGAALALIEQEGQWAFTKRGKPIKYQAYWKRFKAARTKAGIVGVKIRQARKTAGQRALEYGAEHKEVQAMLGHESIRTTEGWYVTVTQDMALRAANRVRL